MQFGPIFVPLLTPQNKEDFFPLIDHILKSGIQDLILFGTTGEGLRYSNAEKKEWIIKIAEYVKGRARLTIGLMSNTFAETVELAQLCEKLHFAAALFPPLLYGNNPAEIVGELMAHTKLPLFLYNPPAFIGKSMNDFSPFLDHPQIVGMKDSAIELSKIPEFVAHNRKSNFRIYLGREDNLEQVFESPIDGLVSGSANIFPELFVNVWKRRDKESFKALERAKAALEALGQGSYIENLQRALRSKMQNFSLHYNGGSR